MKTAIDLPEKESPSKVLESMPIFSSLSGVQRRYRMNVVNAIKLQEDLRSIAKVIDAAKCIRHWHDACGDEGMVVSREHVFKLWEALHDLEETKSKND